MIKLSLSGIFCLLTLISAAQCPASGDIILTTQSEITDFNTAYSSCANLVIDGSLTISGDDILDLSPLSIIKGVNGSLTISSNPILPDLDGLGEILEVGKDLHIDANPLVTSMAGLEKLISVGDTLHLQGNDALIDLTGLPHCQVLVVFLWLKTTH